MSTITCQIIGVSSYKTNGANRLHSICVQLLLAQDGDEIDKLGCFIVHDHSGGLKQGCLKSRDNSVDTPPPHTSALETGKNGLAVLENRKLTESHV